MQANGGRSAFRPLWTSLAFLLPALFSEVPTASATGACAYTQLEGFTGKIEPGVGSKGQPLCDWLIFTGTFLEEIVLRPKVVRLQNTTTFAIWRLEETELGQKYVRDKTYGHEDEVPDTIVYRGYHAIRILILEVNEENVFEIEYTAKAASLEAGTFSPSPLALAGMVAAVILSSVICTAALIYTLCLARAKWRRDEQAALAAVQHELAEQARREHEQKVQSALLQLPTDTWRQEDQEAGGGGRSHAECCLCLEDFQDGDEIKTLPCEHYFHSPCIDRWFSARRNMVRTCPLCKRDPIAELIGRDLERGSARRSEARQDAAAEQGAAANARRQNSARSLTEATAPAEDSSTPPPADEQQASTWATPPRTPPQTAFGRSSIVYSV